MHEERVVLQRGIVADHQGVVLMPRWSVLADIAAGCLVVLFEGHDTTPTDAPFQHNIFAVYQPARHRSPKLKTFLQSLVRSMASATTRENPGGT
jgi:DNA-binding transcriptional LysR family regulator